MGLRTLTAKQQAFLEYVESYIGENGVWPTYREIADELGYCSPNSVTQHLQALTKKNYFLRDQYGYHLLPDGDMRHGIPIRGIISAGHLQEAVEAHLGTITLETLYPDLHRVFALRVSGRSMIGADIEDGDYVLLVDDDIPNGGIGAVLYDGQTSLKRIYTDDKGLRLEPTNPDYDDIRIEPGIFEEVTVLGRYVGHVNKSGVHKPVVEPRRSRNTPPYRRVG